MGGKPHCSGAKTMSYFKEYNKNNESYNESYLKRNAIRFLKYISPIP